jgi:hypothetical protein
MKGLQVERGQGTVEGEELTFHTGKVHVNVVFQQQLLDGQLQVQGIQSRVSICVRVFCGVNGPVTGNYDPRANSSVRRGLKHQGINSAPIGTPKMP